MTPAGVDRDKHLAHLLAQAQNELRANGSVDAATWRQRYPEEAEEVLRLLHSRPPQDAAPASPGEPGGVSPWGGAAAAEAAIPTAGVHAGVRAEPNPTGRPGPRRRRGSLFAGVAGLLLIAAVGTASFSGLFTGKPRVGTLVIRTLHPEALVFINGEQKPVSIDSSEVGRIELAPGTYKVAVKHGSEELAATEVNVKSGEEEELHVVKKPATKKVELVPPPKVTPPPEPYPERDVRNHWAPLDQLRYEDITLVERFEGQPKELVQVLGTHAWRGCASLQGRDRELAFPALHFQPDSKDLMALGTLPGRGETLLWDAVTGQLQQAVLPFAPAAWTPDFHLVAGRSADRMGANRCLVWNVPAKRQRCELAAPKGEEFHRIALAPSGKWGATVQGRSVSGGAQTVTLWDLDKGAALATLLSADGSYPVLTVSADSKQLACGYWTGTEAGKKTFQIRVWDAVTRKEVASLQKEVAGEVNRLAFAPDGKTIAVGGRTFGAGSGAVRVWELASGKEGPTLPANHCFAWSPDGKTLACGTEQGPVVLYNAATGKEQTRLTGLEGAVTTLTFAPDGKRLAAAGLDHSIRVWSASTGKPLNRLPEPVSFLALAPHDRTLVVPGTQKNALEFWDLGTGLQLEYPPLLLPEPLTALDFGTLLCDGENILAFVSAEPKPRVFDLRTGKAVAVPLPANASPLTISKGHSPSFAAASDGKTLALRSGTDVILSDLATGKTRVLKGAGAGNCAFSPDSSTLAVIREGGVSLWDVAAGKELKPLRMPTGSEPQSSGGALAFSRDGQRLAVAPFRSPVIKVFDLASRAELTGFPSPGLGELDGPSWIGFGADDKTVITASRKGFVTLHASATDRREIRLPTLIDNFALTSTGRYAFTSNANGTVYGLRLDAAEKSEPAAK